MSEIKGYINMPFHGESAYEIAVRYGYTGTEEEWINEINRANKIHNYKWYVDTDVVYDSNMKSCGKLSDCMTDDYKGVWFFVRTSKGEAGYSSYASTYTIDGANGYLSLRDYVMWTGKRLVHIPAFEAKASGVKNTDGLYSPKSGVDGLMSSTDKAYLSDLINEYWGKDKLDIFTEPDPKEGWQTNWLFETGVYLGGIKKDCGGHPPVVNDNHTSWVIMVFNGMATDADSLNRNHRVQIAFDVVNSKIYMRRGWMSANTWADAWVEVGAQTTQSDDIVFVTGDAVIKLDKNIKEIVARGSADLKLLLPAETWMGYRCIINFTEADEIVNFDVGTSEGDMFSTDASWSLPSIGKTYVLAQIGVMQVASPSNYDLYEIDSITRQPV